MPARNYSVIGRGNLESMAVKLKVMRSFILVLLFTSMASSIFTVTRKDNGDWFSGWRCGNEFSAYEHTDIGGCHCYHGLTFSTESMTCRSYQERAYYSFSRHGESPTNISTVYAVCGNENLCTLNSTAKNAELPIAVSWNPLTADSNCVVNFVEIIHDCMPRRVDMTLSFTSHATRNHIYLRLHKTMPISYLQGELFQADVTCGVTSGKLMFKFNGTRILSNRGSFAHIPGYDPSETNCTAVTADTDIKPTTWSTDIISPTTTTHTFPPTVTTMPPNHNTAGYGFIIGGSMAGGVILFVLIVILVTVVTCIYYHKKKKRPNAYNQVR